MSDSNEESRPLLQIFSEKQQVGVSADQSDSLPPQLPGIPLIRPDHVGLDGVDDCLCATLTLGDRFRSRTLPRGLWQQQQGKEMSYDGTVLCYSEVPSTDLKVGTLLLQSEEMNEFRRRLDFRLRFCDDVIWPACKF